MSRRAAARLAVVAGALALAACGRSTAPSPALFPLGAEFTLWPGSAVAIQGTGLVVTFEKVDADSRCGTDVVCVWEGDAVVGIQVKGGGVPAARYALHTAHSFAREAAHGGYVIQLRSLAPGRTAAAPPPADAYRATLVVSRS